MGGIWGWATWRRAWLKYDVDIRAWGDYELKKELREKLGWEMYQHRREAWDSLYMNSLRHGISSGGLPERLIAG